MDALSLLCLGNVFTSALSGNTVLLGIAIVQGQVKEAVLCSTVFLGFIPGAIMGAVFLRSVPGNSQWNPRITSALAIESVVLITFVLGLVIAGDSNETSSLAPLVVLSAFTMGLQYMTMLRLNVNGVTTTFVTSTIVKLACRLAVPDRPRGPSPSPTAGYHEESRPRWSDRTNRFLAMVWISYFIGASASAVLTSWGRVVAAMFSLLLVCGIVLYAAFTTPHPS